jgi:hypothetical protein
MSPSTFAKQMADQYDRAPKLMKVFVWKKDSLSALWLYRMMGCVWLIFSLISFYGALFSPY